MKVVSLFDGISCLRVALGNRPDMTYYASEIDKNAIKISTKNYPDSIHLGSVTDVSGLTNIDLLCGGSPCTDLSIAKTDRKGLEGERSKLFWEFVRIWKECKPTWFILENVASMPEKDKQIITTTLGVEPILIDARLVSAQTRKRYFWTNIPIKGLPVDRGIVLKDILQLPEEVDSSFTVNGKFTKIEKKPREFHQPGTSGIGLIQIGHIGASNGQANRVYDINGKSVTLTANGGGGGAKTGIYEIGSIIRKLTPIECERLMGLPDNYTEGISKTARYKAIGNAFNVDVMRFILGFI